MALLSPVVVEGAAATNHGRGVNFHEVPAKKQVDGDVSGPGA